MKTRQTTPRNALEPPTVPSGHTPVVATDLDRTFTKDDLRLSQDAIQQARQLRRRGVRMVLVTGRRASEIPVPQLRDAFDAMVLEGGAVWGRPGHWTIPPTAQPFWTLSERLAAAGHDVRDGWASFSAPVAAEADIAAQSAHANAHANVDRIDVTPPGVDKATGFRHALDALQIPRPWILSIGDGRNDIPLARVANVSVAVANAEAELVEAAAIHSPHPAHRGFLWAVQGLAKWDPTVTA